MLPRRIDIRDGRIERDSKPAAVIAWPS
jgi:hypothetical protein